MHLHHSCHILFETHLQPPKALLPPHGFLLLLPPVDSRASSKTMFSSPGLCTQGVVCRRQRSHALLPSTGVFAQCHQYAPIGHQLLLPFLDWYPCSATEVFAQCQQICRQISRQLRRHMCQRMGHQIFGHILLPYLDRHRCLTAEAPSPKLQTGRRETAP